MAESDTTFFSAKAATNPCSVSPACRPICPPCKHDRRCEHAARKRLGVKLPKAPKVSWQMKQAQRLVKAAKGRATDIGMSFDLTNDWAYRKIVKGVCSVTGLALVQPAGGRGPWVPSIDRIDPKVGYIQENCRIVCWIYNAAKHTYDDDTVLQLAMAIATEDRINDFVRRVLEK